MVPGKSAEVSSRRNGGFVLRPFVLAVMTAALVACGGGGGSGGGAGDGGGNGGGGNGGGGNGGGGNGGGGDNGGGTPVVVQTIAGTVVDGYVAGATVSCLSSGSVLAVTTSDATGNYAFELDEGEACDTIESQGGIDIGKADDPADDRPAPTGAMRAPVTSDESVSGLFVSPLTTLVQQQVAAGATPDEAQANVRNSFGLPASVDLLAADPLADVPLYRATAVVAQLVDQISAGLAAVGGITDAAGRTALADAVYGTVVSQLGSLSMAGLAPALNDLTPASPLFGLVQEAANKAKASDTVGAALQNVNAATFAAIATPLVASATSSMASAESADAGALAGSFLNEQARTATLLATVSDAVSLEADDPQAILTEVRTALAEAETTRTDATVSLVIDGQTITGTMPGVLSNYVVLRNDELLLQGPSGTTAVPRETFEWASAFVPKELSAVGFGLDASAGNAQLSDTPVEVPLAIEVKDATRTFQAIIDRVAFAADDSNRVHANLPEGAKLYVYGKNASAETTEPLVVTLAGEGLQIVSTDGDGVITYSFDRLFDTISPVAAGGVLETLVQNRVDMGSYDVTIVIGTLRAAYGNPDPLLAALGTVTLGAGGQSVSGHGIKGKVVVQP